MPCHNADLVTKFGRCTLCTYVKVNITFKRPWRPRRRVGVQLYSFFNLNTRGSRVVKATPRLLYLRERVRYPLYRRLRGSQRQSGRVRKIPLPPVFDPRTVQPVARRYTDYVIPAHLCNSVRMQNCDVQFISCSIPCAVESDIHHSLITNDRIKLGSWLELYYWNHIDNQSRDRHFCF